MRPTDPNRAVAIVGAGPAGLAAAAALQRRGIGATVYEQDAVVGARWQRRYERLRLHTLRRFSGLPYRPMPRAYPRYVPKDLFAQYLREYADHFGLHVRLGQRVLAIGQERSGNWRVETGGGPVSARVVIVATGHHNVPRPPRWPDVDRFEGRMLHADEYRDPSPFVDSRVLVVGAGNSGAEIAAELADHGIAVDISIRTPPPIVPRELLGWLPVQVLGLLLTPVPAPRAIDGAGRLMRRVALGDLRDHGIGDAAWGPFTARRPAVIDAGFVSQVRARRVRVRPHIERFDQRGAVFAGGEAGHYDAVIAAIGYSTGLHGLLAAENALDGDGVPHVLPDGASDRPGLYFIGFAETVRGHLFEIDRTARRMARSVDRYLRMRAPDADGSPRRPRIAWRRRG